MKTAIPNLCFQNEKCMQVNPTNMLLLTKLLFVLLSTDLLRTECHVYISILALQQYEKTTTRKM